jgi:hypothetical protein
VGEIERLCEADRPEELRLSIKAAEALKSLFGLRLVSELYTYPEALPEKLK